MPEVEQLADAAVGGFYRALDRALYLSAAMTGLRQGELIALRWQDVDWRAQRIRVRQKHVLGEYGTPKFRRSTRSVPMSTRVAAELDALHRASKWQGDDDLVFADPNDGEVLRRGALMRRYRRALKVALLDVEHRFHDLRHTFGTAMAASGVPMRQRCLRAPRWRWWSGSWPRWRSRSTWPTSAPATRPTARWPGWWSSSSGWDHRRGGHPGRGVQRRARARRPDRRGEPGAERELRVPERDVPKDKQRPSTA